MLFYPKSFTLKSFLTSHEVLTNVARFALHLIGENNPSHNVISGNLILIAVALAIRPAQRARAVLFTYLWEFTQLPVIISIFSEPLKFT